MNVRTISMILLCGLLMACRHEAGILPLSEECKTYFDLEETYLDKLEASRKFSPDEMACFRRDHATRLANFRNPLARNGHSEEEVDRTCRVLLKLTREGMQMVEGLASLSKEQFDANWRGRGCASISPSQK